MLADQHAMISIKPRYASSILSGAKTIELRRKFMKLPVGSKLWIYSTLPVGAVVGVATLKSIDRDVPARLWSKYRSRVQIGSSVFNEYFRGCDEGVALELMGIEALTPVGLEEIREIRGVKSMPQVAVKITTEQANCLSRIGAYV